MSGNTNTDRNNIKPTHPTAGPVETTLDMNKNEVSLILKLNVALVKSALKSCQLMVKENDKVTLYDAPAIGEAVVDALGKIPSVKILKEQGQYNLKKYQS